MEVAALGLKVEGVEGIDRAAASLDGLSAAGVKAEKSTQGVGKGSAGAKPSVDALAASADKAAQAEARLAAQAEKAGISVGQMKASLRGVPAQFTDIAVSLQGGMSPLTVFLQQGGQLKDMFGGAGSAARALGGYVLGLVNPFTVAAAGAAALGLAYFQGSKEQDAFMVSMAKTGNAAGLTTSGLKAYAEQISATSGTQGKAAESLNIFIESGVKAGTGLARLTETAIAWEKATGEGVDKVAAKYVALQNDPLKAALKLNEGMNFLTLSVYEQVKSLEEQGRTTDAAKVAMDALDSAMAERSKTIEQNLGSIQRAWNGVAGAAKWAWDKMLNVGREDSIDQQLSKARESLDKLQTEAPGLMERGTHAARLKRAQEVVSSLEAESAAQALNAAATEYSTKAVAAKAAWDKIVTANASKQEKMEIALANVRERAAAAGVTGKELETQLAAEREKYADKTKKSTVAVNAAKTAYESLIVSINEKISATKSELASGEKQSEADKLRSRYQQELTTRSRQFTEAQKNKIESDIAALDAAEKQLIVAKALEKAWADDAKALEAYTKKQDDYLKTVTDSVTKLEQEEEGHALAAQAGITHAQAMQQLALARLEDARAQMLQGAGSAEEIERINQEIAARQKLLGLLGTAQAREANANAAKDALKDWEKTSQKIGDTLSDYIMGGGKDAATYLKRLFANLVLEPVVKGLVGNLFGGTSGGGGSGDLLGSLGNLKSIYSAFTGGLTSTLGGAIGKLGSTFGSSALTSFSNGMTGKTIASNMIGPSVSVPNAASAAGTSAVSAMSYVPYIAAIMAGMKMSGNAFDEGYRGDSKELLKAGVPFGIAVATDVTQAIGKMFGMSEKTANIITGGALWAKGATKLGLMATPHTGAGAIYQGGSLQEGRDIYNKGVFGMGDPKEYAASAQSAISSVATQIGVTLDGVAMAFGKKAGFSVATSFADDISKDGAWGSLKITDSLGKVLLDWTEDQKREGVPREFGNGAEGYEQYVKAAQADMLSAIQQMDIAGWAKQMFGDATIDTLTETMRSVAMVMAKFTELGETMATFAGISDEVQTTLINVSGGMDALSANAQSFYQGFYTEGERAQNLREQQINSLSGMGLYIDPGQGNDAKEMFRSTVEEAMASGQTELAAKLLMMSQSFSDSATYWQQVLDDSAEETARTIEKAQSDAKAILDERYSLESTYLQLVGETDELRARELNTLGASNRELQKMIWARQDEAEAASKAAQKMADTQKAIDSVTSGFSGLRETITLDQLGTDEAKYGYFKAQADSLTRMLPQLQDQEAITRAVNEIQSLTSRAYGSLDAEQKVEMGDEFLQYLSKTEDLALKSIERVNDENAKATGKAVGDAVSKEVGRIVDAIASIASESGQLSRETVEAIRRLSTQTGNTVVGTGQKYAEVNA